MAVASPSRPPTAGPPLPPLPPGTWPAQGEWTYDDYRRLPDTPDGRYEVIFGVLYMSNTPLIVHQVIARQLVVRLVALLGERAGTVLFAPVEVRLPGVADPAQPDVLFVSEEHEQIIGEQYIAGAPDLVIEILSQSTARLDRHVKLRAYEQGGVAEYWIVDPKARMVEVYVLDGGEYAQLGEFIDGEKLQSQVLAGLDLDVSALFAR